MRIQPAPLSPSFNVGKKTSTQLDTLAGTLFSNLERPTARKRNQAPSKPKGKTMTKANAPTFAEALTSAFTMDAEHYDPRQGVYFRDELAFARKIVTEAMLDKLYWLIHSDKGAAAYADKKRNELVRINGDYRPTHAGDVAAMATGIRASEAANQKQMLLEEYERDLHAAYLAEHGDEYVPYGSTQGSNVSASQIKGALPADLQARLEAMGIQPPANADRKTDGDRKAG